MGKKTELNGLDKKTLHKMLYDMMLIRHFEEKAGQMYGLKKIGGFCHLYNGEEAVAVGAIAAIDLKKDYLLTGYRDHGHALACGMDPRTVMAELFGKITGCSRGKGGSMHLFDREKHFLGGNGIVAAQIPVATGVAFAEKYQNTGGVTLCFFGDGAIHQGAFHESLNLAKIWNLPIVYICENNEWGMGTNFRKVSAVDDFSLLGVAYGIPGKRIDGMNVLEVYQEVSLAVKQAQTSGLPSLLEARTYRYRGHSMSDPAKYRTREEVEEYKKRDPLIIFKDTLMQEGLLTEGEYQEYEGKIQSIVDEAVEFAEKSEEPALHTLYEDILVE
ncbi:MAG: pyruvate dehydrogenase (acetyl-transferring) E1 component subunit alpha [Spirochaetales bacterium]|nr:pyruvate dehydrogenase (acetyl-transferring) E1 component subunit alpha [Spirochaetales bacterium]